MKILITLAVIALLIVAAIFYFGGGELDIAPKATPSAANAPKRDFSALSNLLKQDMTNVPIALDAPRIAPANAFSVKSRLAGAAGAGPEYQTLAQVCDLIVFADNEHSVRQAQDLQTERGIAGDPMASAKANQLTTANTRAAVHAKAQADWEDYRRQTDAEVHRLLATLPGAKP